MCLSLCLSSGKEFVFVNNIKHIFGYVSYFFLKHIYHLHKIVCSIDTVISNIKVIQISILNLSSQYKKLSILIKV